MKISAQASLALIFFFCAEVKSLRRAAGGGRWKVGGGRWEAKTYRAPRSSHRNGIAPHRRNGIAPHRRHGIAPHRRPATLKQPRPFWTRKRKSFARAIPYAEPSGNDIPYKQALSGLVCTDIIQYTAYTAGWRCKRILINRRASNPENVINDRWADSRTVTTSTIQLQLQ